MKVKVSVDISFFSRLQKRYRRWRDHYYYDKLDEQGRAEENDLTTERNKRINEQIIRERNAADMKRKAKYILSQVIFTLLTLLCIVGIAGLTFFFVHDFGVKNALNPALTYTIGGIFGSIVLTGYFFLFTVSAFKANKKAYEDSLIENEIELSDQDIPEEDIQKKIEHLIESYWLLSYVHNHMKQKEENHRSRVIFEKFLRKQSVRYLIAQKNNDDEDKAKEDKDKKTLGQKIAMIVNLLIGAAAIVFLGGGNYLGIMDVGSTFGAASIFQPIAVISAVSMFATMFIYFAPDMKKNAAKGYKYVSDKVKGFFSKEKKVIEKKPKPPLTWAAVLAGIKKAFLPESLIRFGFKLFAIGAAIGFASFKLYSTVHVMKLLSVVSPAVTGIVGAIAFGAMLIMTATTSSVDMWKKGDLVSKIYQKRREIKLAQKEHEIAPTPKPKKPFLFYFAWAITFSIAAINGGGAFIGMYSLVNLLPAGQILFIIIGIFSAISRFAELSIYYGPKIAKNMSGVEPPEAAEIELAKLDAELEKIKHPQAEQFEYAQVKAPANDKFSHGFSSPTSASDKHRGREVNYAVEPTKFDQYDNNDVEAFLSKMI